MPEISLNILLEGALNKAKKNQNTKSGGHGFLLTPPADHLELHSYPDVIKLIFNVKMFVCIYVY